MAGDNNDAAEEAAPDVDDDDDEKGGNVREQDRFLPIANISRIMESAAREREIAKDAKETVQECLGVHQFYHQRGERQRESARPSTATTCCGPWRSFEEYVEPLKVYLQVPRD